MEVRGARPWCLARFVRAHIRYSQPIVAKGILLSSQGTVVSDTLQSVIGTVALIHHNDATWWIRLKHLQCSTNCSRKQNFGQTAAGFRSFSRSAAREAKSSRITGCRKRSAGLGAIRFNPEEHQETTERQLWIELCLEGVGKGVL